MSVDSSGASASFASKEVGTWTVTATGFALSGADKANYAIASVNTTTAQITSLGLIITVTSPNGGESIAQGSTPNLTWSVSSPVLTGEFQLWVVDSADTYHYAGARPAEPLLTDYSLSWTADLPVAGGYKLAVFYRPDASVWSFTANDMSDAGFAVASALSLTVTSPNGGESIAQGSTPNLTWSVSSPVLTGEFQLWVVDSADTYHYAGARPAEPLLTDYSLSWTADLPVAGGYKLAVFYRPDASVWSFTANDMSDAGFAVASALSLTVTSPNGGESIAQGSTPNLTWSVSSPVLTGEFQLWVVDSADTYHYAGARPAEPLLTDYSLSWTADLPVAGGYRLAVFYRPDASVWSFTANDMSDAGFAVASALNLTVTSPNGGESIAQGSTPNLTWSVSSPVLTGEFQLWVVDSADTYHYAGARPAEPLLTDYSLSWTADLPVAGGYKLAVFYRPDASVWSFTANDMSDAGFAVATPPLSLAVTRPNGGENVPYGTQDEIQWSLNQTVSTGYFDVWALSSTKGSIQLNSSPVAVDPAKTTYSFAWTVNRPLSTITRSASTTAMMAAGSIRLDDSNATFSVVQPGLAVTAPNGGDNLIIGDPTDVTWTLPKGAGCGFVRPLRRQRHAGPAQTQHRPDRRRPGEDRATPTPGGSRRRRRPTTGCASCTTTAPATRSPGTSLTQTSRSHCRSSTVP